VIFVDGAADELSDISDGGLEGLFIAEGFGDSLEEAFSFDKYFFGTVDQYLGDRIVLEIFDDRIEEGVD
jgi:hypothetical protein